MLMSKAGETHAPARARQRRSPEIDLMKADPSVKSANIVIEITETSLCPTFSLQSRFRIGPKDRPATKSENGRIAMMGETLNCRSKVECAGVIIEEARVQTKATNAVTSRQSRQHRSFSASDIYLLQACGTLFSAHSSFVGYNLQLASSGRLTAIEFPVVLSAARNSGSE